MSADDYLLTPDFEQQVCAFVRAGGYPLVAAEAAGVPADVFARWLREGLRRDGPPDCRQLARAVRQAQAHARLAAEARAFQDKPLDWLKSGPGKDTGGAPGWTTPPRPAPAAAASDWTGQPELLELLGLLLQALQPFPEALRAVAGLVASRVPGLALDGGPPGPDRQS
jgi:hypothetical protein